MHLLLLGVGGFIGSHLLERILADTNWRVTGVDIQNHRIVRHDDNPNFTYVNLDVYDREAVRALVCECDTVISLVALCNPALYNTIPLRVIDINFTRPYELAQMCAQEKKWLIHFSTCEIYGRTISSFDSGNSNDPSRYILKEDEAPLIMGPISAQRWSYACAKQLLERVMYALAFEQGLAYTAIRPFNFVGPRMDFIPGIDGEGVPRVLACFMEALLFGKPLKLVDGGINKRCFTDIRDAVDAIFRILQNPEKSKGQAFNIGNPHNEASIAELAHAMVRIYKELRSELPSRDFSIVNVSSEEFYGPGYEDSDRRVPDISKAQNLLGWQPHVSIDDALRGAIASYIDLYAEMVPSDRKS